MGVTEDIVRFIDEASFHALPDEVIFRAKTLIVDAIGTMLAGSVEEGSRILQRYLMRAESRNDATVVGAGFKGCGGAAALANAAAGHALDFDSIQFSVWPGTAHGIRIHPTTPALAAALAVGEPRNITGRDLILACAVGIEVGCRVTEAIPPDSYQVAYQSTATMGGLGAAAAAGKILGLNRDQLMRAMGLAATMAGGLRENFGTMTKPFHSGRSAEAGVLATELALDGFTSAPHILEAHRGFFLAMGGKHDPSQISGKLGTPYFIMEPGLHIKRYPCAILVHPAIATMIETANAHSLTAENIARIEVGVSDVITSTLNHPEPKTGLEGKFSVAFPLAHALIERRVSLNDFTDERVNDPKVQGLMKKIVVRTDPKLLEGDGNEVTARLMIELTDGQRIERLASLERGKAQKWISISELEEKFRQCAARVIPADRAKRAFDLALELDSAKSVHGLMELVGAKA
ncbi:MAG: MmgE/PrpD family protein [Deltaproteobacteria bacterium]|nr:MmgE/PrpD family protein [Deltaproteobacteria bacterium]